eukprot:8146239-Alexandrium_andersonii.AAC.1
MASTTEVTAAGSSGNVRSAHNVVDQLVASVNERSESAVDEIMRIVEAAPTFFNDPGLKSQAIAKVIMVFAKRLNAGEEHVAQLGDLVANISTS